MATCIWDSPFCACLQTHPHIFLPPPGMTAVLGNFPVPPSTGRASRLSSHSAFSPFPWQPSSGLSELNWCYCSLLLSDVTQAQTHTVQRKLSTSIRPFPTLDFQRNKPRRLVNQMKIQSQHSKCLKFLPAGSSRVHTLNLTWRP